MDVEKLLKEYKKEFCRNVNGELIDEFYSNIKPIEVYFWWKNKLSEVGVQPEVSGDCERAITVKQLAVIYKKHPSAIADLCDEVLDKSGALLGYVRDAASNSR